MKIYEFNIKDYPGVYTNNGIVMNQLRKKLTSIVVENDFNFDSVIIPNREIIKDGIEFFMFTTLEKQNLIRVGAIDSFAVFQDKSDFLRLNEICVFNSYELNFVDSEITKQLRSKKIKKILGQ